LAGSFSDYLENALLDGVIGGTAFTKPSPVYVALFTDTNTSNQRDAGTVTEVSGNSYARVSVTNNATNFPNAASGSKSNGTTIAFPTASGSWGTVTAFGIYDASSAGNLLLWGDLTVSKTVTSGDTLSFASTGLSVSLD